MTEETQPKTNPGLDAMAPYDFVRAEIAKAKAENAAMVFDYATPDGNKRARSHVYGLRRKKGEVEAVRKDLKAASLEYGRKVDKIANELTGEIETMIALHQKPLDELEAKETARNAAHEARLLELQVPTEVMANAATLQAVIDRVAAVVIDETWEEYHQQAATLQQATLRTLEHRHVDLLKLEAERAELDRLRKEAAEREARDKAAKEAAEREAREAKLVADATERARVEAERKAAADAAEQARKEKAAADAALAAEREKTARAEKAVADAKRRAAEQETARVKAEQDAKAAEEKRAANARHRAKVLQVAEDALMVTLEMAESHRGLVKAMVAAIADGKVPGVSVRF